MFLVAMLFVLRPDLLQTARHHLIPPKTNLAQLIFGVVLSCIGWVVLISMWWIFIRTTRSRSSMEIEMANDGLATTLTATRCEFTWQFFTGYVQMDHLLVLRRADNLIMAVPRRAFADADEFEKFRRAINENVVATVVAAKG